MKLTVEVNRVPTLDMIHQYLEDDGWERHSKSIFIEYYHSEEDITLSIPSDESFADYERRIVELLESLAILEDRDSYSVWKDIEDYR